MLLSLWDVTTKVVLPDSTAVSHLSWMDETSKEAASTVSAPNTTVSAAVTMVQTGVARMLRKASLWMAPPCALSDKSTIFQAGVPGAALGHPGVVGGHDDQGSLVGSPVERVTNGLPCR